MYYYLDPNGTCVSSIESDKHYILYVVQVHTGEKMVRCGMHTVYLIHISPVGLYLILKTQSWQNWSCLAGAGRGTRLSAHLSVAYDNTTNKFTYACTQTHTYVLTLYT